ncbi:HAD ATPase, P-type, IC family protein [Clostridium argentinense CDC 2741]|uniref:HAD ATPase, P-type, IC family protein n=1 Tax=Clostridium argentinense CDC 2741 TaxID=1418104 RepID=A0A0C1TVQ7_9CLOT|nr:cation-translocating P-type ATPase [Clostridium argentinense]ARC83829.1 ATPase [Clostridium argentinense]KIE44824.1 HAD ATPase, P-type, IC family protein [Clostridium argentinense CDC 2741]NFF39737.1 cation-translocating P-type ATPase [Clostridium argentinense]NFP49737.1 cation-translocating P-type ATPase [Clostridium argentinense]NFP72138.1 cation-translocating P-type ATPase [Clostridium argentinense]
MKDYYKRVPEELFNMFNSNSKGLGKEEVEKKRSEYGYNELTEGKKKSILQIFFEQFKDLLVLILVAAALISMSIGNVESTIVIFAVITINAVLGTVQYIKAEQSLNSLKALSAPMARVLREGKKIEIPSREVVPGDILFLEAGDYISADGRIIENYSIQINESSLTGESESAIKNIDIITEDNIPIGDQKNMVFAGSLVTYGRAMVLVTSIGMSTELGKIATLLDNTKEKRTPLQISLDNFGKKLASCILVICAVVFLLNMYRGYEIVDSLMFAVSLAVAAIPEALSSIVTIVLALGTQKMASENAIIRKLQAVESLGCVSIICSDKTGTLTQNKMTVSKIYTNEEIISSKNINLKEELHNKLLLSSLLCNDAISNDENGIGDPTEIALTDLGKIYSLKELDVRKNYPRLCEIPFDSERKLMSTVHEVNGKTFMLTKGALDVLLNRTINIETKDGIKKLTNHDKIKIENINKDFSNEGLRVLAFCYKEIDNSDSISLDDENDLTFLGLISMIDPPREESKKAVEDCIRAGIRPVMITGDHKITASAIAKKIGILQKDCEAIEGVELDKLSDEELKEKVDKISVYARVSPEHKIRIVRAWQEKGNVVAMTGDGVNDAPALKQADIGVAMGITGTEVAKDAASMVLTDDNFSTIVKAISNGRNIYTNIKNSIKFLISGNAAGILSVLYASLAALPMPFAAVHLLFINLLTDSLPAIALGLEPQNNNVLNEKPRDINAPILSKAFLKEVLTEGLIIAICTMIAFHIGLNRGNQQLASTMAFLTLCIARLFHGFNCRSKNSIFKVGVFTNKYSWFAFLSGLILLNVVLAFEPLRRIFELSKLGLNEYILVYILAFIPLLLVQLSKLFIDGKSTTNSYSFNKNLVDKM